MTVICVSGKKLLLLLIAVQQVNGFVHMEVDCSADGKETCRSNGVKGYPTLKVFRHGQFEADYAGPRHAGYL